jgi:hypothetical protein
MNCSLRYIRRDISLYFSKRDVIIRHSSATKVAVGGFRGFTWSSSAGKILGRFTVADAVEK